MDSRRPSRHALVSTSLMPSDVKDTASIPINSPSSMSGVARKAIGSSSAGTNAVKSSTTKAGSSKSDAERTAFASAVEAYGPLFRLVARVLSFPTE